jgi:hypothetical protein
MSICDNINNNKLHNNTSIDKKICCNDNTCKNVDTTCYAPRILVKCQAINSADACQRHDLPDSGKMNNALAREFCDEKNQSKHICVSTNSTISSPDLDNELGWIINRTNELGNSCQVCACYNNSKQQYERTQVNCSIGCDSDTLFKLCSSLPSSKGLVCDDIFGSGSCRLYNISTKEEITTYPKGPLFYKSEMCDFTVSTTPINNDPPNRLSDSDKITLGTSIGFGVPLLILAGIGVIKWQQLKVYIRNFRNRRQQQPLLFIFLFFYFLF